MDETKKNNQEMDTTTAANFFHIFVTGQIESARFPLGPDGTQVFCRYEIHSGPDWELLSGLKSGITQSSLARKHNSEIVFNMPIEVSFKSTNPFGWPQIIVSVYGKNLFGAETCLGYGRTYLPIFGGNGAPETGTNNQLSHHHWDKNKIIVPILIPRCTNLLAEFLSWFTRKNPELKDPKILLDPVKCRNLPAESYGELVLSLQTISQGAGQMGYDWGQFKG